MKEVKIIVDGNEAAAQIAYKVSDVCAIYPITPATAMGEWADGWASQERKNIWEEIPRVVEMQSEAGAAGAVHGALLGGALTTTFTASQGLLLMIPNMFKIAGELTPCVFHIAARTIATHALSIFGDHSDVMAVRTTGFAMLFSNNVQEAMDLALMAHAATLKARIPFLHIFDGFRTSHEINKIEAVTDEIIRAMMDEEAVKEFKKRKLTPEQPVIRGTAQNPDVFFQGRERANIFYNNLPSILKKEMQRFAVLTGRNYHLFDYTGHPQAERMIVLMGSGAGAVEETVDYLNKKGEKVGVVKVRLFRPFSVGDFIKSIPSTVKKIAVLDRTKEPGAIGEPLYQDVTTAYAEVAGSNGKNIKIIGGRYGLASKEFTPAMVKAIFDELKKENPKNHFTIGIKDDITGTSLEYDENFSLDNENFSAVFYGLGSDGTVSANKNSIKIIGESTDNFVQGYFEYDSKKSGTMTISHLRFGKEPICSTYLVSSADFVACHQFNFLSQYDVLKKATKGAIFLLNAPYKSNEIRKMLPAHILSEIMEKEIRFYVIDATKVAKELHLGGRINTILQTCFFAISNIIPFEVAKEKIKKAIERTYAAKGRAVVEKNFHAVEKATSCLYQIVFPKEITGRDARCCVSASDGDETSCVSTLSKETPGFVRNVLEKIMKAEGDVLPVSALPADGTFPSATTQWEKRNIAVQVPQWDEQLCTQCNKCVLICPHAAIRAKVYDKNLLADAPSSFKSAAPVGKEFNREKEAYTLQVAAEDCTGCSLCIEFCPIEDKEKKGYKPIHLVDRWSVHSSEKENWNFFINIPELERTRVNPASVKGSQFLQPLFEFSGACAGCGETPYLKLLSQLFGENMIVANATGCSSIYGGNLPTTPWAMNREGRGPAWANSLFEDNAEFGLGIRLAINKRQEKAKRLLQDMKDEIGDELVNKILNSNENSEEEIKKQRERIRHLKQKLHELQGGTVYPAGENGCAVEADINKIKELAAIADDLSKKIVWIVGGDGWAYDIGYGGLDHILASGEKVNLLVMDTEVYSNTGGQTSKATPLGASAKFSILGKKTPKKDLALQVISYGNVYVAQIAIGAKDTQAVRAIAEAENFPGTSLVIAYSHCISHGYDLKHGAGQQEKAVQSGYWNLFRFNPLNEKGKRFSLDSGEPFIPLREYLHNETRYSRLLSENGSGAKELLARAEANVREKWERLKSLSVL